MLLPGDTLRLLEEAAQDTPDKLEAGFTAYSECSSVGECKINKFKIN
jgi:hypothetical protein